jgi:hypothetical protein
MRRGCRMASHQVDVRGNDGMSGMKPLLEISMGMDAFSSEWLHCDRLSSYIARMVSHNRSDSLLYANLLNSALNELLETVFANHGADGEFSCRISRDGGTDVIEITMPCDEKTGEFYAAAANRLAAATASQTYQAALFSGGPPDPHLGLLEIAADYRARISIEPAGSRLKLSAEMTLEGAVS